MVLAIVTPTKLSRPDTELLSQKLATGKFWEYIISWIIIVRSISFGKCKWNYFWAIVSRCSFTYGSKPNERYSCQVNSGRWQVTGLSTTISKPENGNFEDFWMAFVIESNCRWQSEKFVIVTSMKLAPSPTYFVLISDHSNLPANDTKWNTWNRSGYVLP